MSGHLEILNWIADEGYVSYAVYNERSGLKKTIWGKSGIIGKKYTTKQLIKLFKNKK